MKKIDVKSLHDFYLEHFKNHGLISTDRPGKKEILKFLFEKGFCVGTKSKILFSMFVWEFWTKKNLDREPDSYIYTIFLEDFEINWINENVLKNSFVGLKLSYSIN